MSSDIFAALDRYKQNTESIELNTGSVLSIGVLTAQVIVGRGGGSGQPCSFNNDIVLGRGDTVLLVRPIGEKMWSVVAVIGHSRAGNSIVSRPTPNNAPGSPHWAAVNLQTPNGLSWSGTALTDIVSATLPFNGGSPMLIFNGYVTSGASDVQMDIGWGEGNDYQVTYRATIMSTVPYTPVNIVDLLGGQLNGLHTFNVRAQLGAGAITPVLNCTRFAVMEI